MKKTFYARYAKVILGVTLALVPLLVLGAHRALRDGNNDVRQWLPRGFAETQQYDWFLQHFGSEEIAVVSWPGCTLDDQRLDRLAAGLAPWTKESIASGAVAGSQSEDAGAHVTADGKSLFQRVLTGRQAVAELTSAPLNLSRQEALLRLQGTLIGPDQKTSGLVVLVSQEGAADRHAALETIYRVAKAEAGLARDELRLGGPTVDSVALDSESERSRYRLASLSVVLALVLAWRCLKQMRLVLIVFVTAILCAGTSVALVHYTGNTMSLMMISMPTLIYVLAISGSVHLVNYYRDAIASGGIDGAPERVIAAGWLPCTLTALTTAVGLGSLGISNVLPVKMFGIYSALGVLCSLVILFLFLPAALQLWPLREEKTRPVSKPEGLSGTAWSSRLSAWVARRHAWAAACCLLLMAVMSAGLLRLDTSVKLLSLFSPQSRIIQDYTWLEEHLGPLVPVEIIVHLDHHSPLSLLERLTLVGEMNRQLDQIDKVAGAMSAATFTPTIPEGGGLRQTIKRRLMENNLADNREQFAAHYVRDAEEGELWRVSARVEALNALDYGQFMGLLRDRLQPLLDQYSATSGSEIGATYTGLVPLIYKAQRELLNDLTTSFVSAFLVVGMVMIVMLRSLRAGLVAMLPNVFPAAIIFGAMGWSGKLLDIGAMMTASVALGIAVDDTIHFLSWFRRGLKQGLSRQQAIQLAYERCAGAMLQTTIICGLGLLVFALSSFVPTASFSWMIFSLLAAALVGDLVFLPALLAGPLGKLFENKAVGTGFESINFPRWLWPIRPEPVLANAAIESRA
ncbi:MAG TPA: MMPL family transporter [Pirellulaceae bacterium]|nr:MMPL family transporter [Pirellulaceae bacterium]